LLFLKLSGILLEAKGITEVLPPLFLPLSSRNVLVIQIFSQRRRENNLRNGENAFQ
jgi:hypothetical protein